MAISLTDLVGMQFHELMQVSSNVASALGTPDRTRLFFVHQDTAAGAEPSPPKVIAFGRKAELFWLFRLAYKAGMKSLCHVLRQFHVAALTDECASLFFQNITTFRAVHCEDCSCSCRKQAFSPIENCRVCGVVGEMGIYQQLSESISKEGKSLCQRKNAFQ